VLVSNYNRQVLSFCRTHPKQLQYNMTNWQSKQKNTKLALFAKRKHFIFSIITRSKATREGEDEGVWTLPHLPPGPPIGFAQNWWEIVGYSCPKHTQQSASTKLLIAVKITKIYNLNVTFQKYSGSKTSRLLQYWGRLRCPYPVYRRGAGLLSAP